MGQCDKKNYAISTIELMDENGVIQYLGEGVFSRMFTNLNTPSSLRNYLITTMEYTEE